MTKKTVMQKEVAINEVVPFATLATFYATGDAASEFAEYGKLVPSIRTPNLYFLYVDRRFNFDEVVAFIENYGN